MGLRCLTLFCKDFGTCSPGSNLGEHISKNGDCSSNTGLFSESGLVEVLERLKL